MKIAYFDCCAGISGDMVLGALVDSGLDVSILRRELAKLHLGDYSISASKDERHHITGTNIKVRFKESGHHRTFKEIKNIINKSRLTTKVKVLSTSIFENLAKAEAKVHGCRVDDVHFHEVGAIDSIVDIVGTAIGIEKLGIGQVYASPLPLGSGWVKTSHGRMPVPAPATLELLKGVPVASSPATSELTTPTGAAIIKTLSLSFGNMPHMEIEGTGYGIGDRSFKEIPNILRLIIGKRTGNTERLIIVETNMDDMNPQIYEYLMSRLFKNGALDVFLMPIQMKKGRPAILLKVLCPENKKGNIIDTIFEETTTIGVRTYEVERHCLERRIENVSTPYGKVRVKVAERNGKVLNIQPEYEDCKEIAEKKKLPLKEVMDSAKKAFLSKK
ncbi:MAG: TIGR00299 family protein [Deltaproteobacteria bacterium RIFCSPLOWO2_02_44_9]|nr:MAG: TIGR00299 family protein [Deltaproteobacteria bacterium RIFCSPLOWO2_02_44_9]